VADPLAHHAHDHDHEHEAHGHGHGDARRHAHAHAHSHSLVHESIKRSREGLRAVGLAVVVLGVTAIVQLAIFVASGSVALLADRIHNFGDAANGDPARDRVRAAQHSHRARGWARRRAGDRRERLRRQATRPPTGSCTRTPRITSRRSRSPAHSASPATGGPRGFARVPGAGSTARAGRDGAHARADAYVSLAAVASALTVAAGVGLADR
jgi:hypothetical protein